MKQKTKYDILSRTEDDDDEIIKSSMPTLYRGDRYYHINVIKNNDDKWILDVSHGIVGDKYKTNKDIIYVDETKHREGSENFMNEDLNAYASALRAYISKMKDGYRLEDYIEPVFIEFDNNKEIKKLITQFLHINESSVIQTARFIYPMLANREFSIERIKKYIKLDDGDATIEPKFNGHRCMAFWESDEKVRLFTRNAKEMFSLDHITKELINLFTINDAKDYCIDGEIYDPTAPRNIIASRVSKQTQKSLKLTKSELIKNKYYIFDIADVIAGLKMKFVDRYRLLKHFMRSYSKKFKLNVIDDAGTIYAGNKEWKTSNLIVVRAYFVESINEIISIYNEFLEEGLEGAMIRNNSVYKPSKEGGTSRSNDIQKLKQIEFDFFRIIGFEESIKNKSSKDNRVSFSFKVTYACTKQNEKIDSTNSFMVGATSGTVTYRKELLDELKETKGKKYIGKYILISFAEYSKGGRKNGGHPVQPRPVTVDGIYKIINKNEFKSQYDDIIYDVRNNFNKNIIEGDFSQEK